MNTTRRNAIKAIAIECEALRRALDGIRARLDTILEDEQTYLDDMPESLANGARGAFAQAGIDALEAALERFDEAECAIIDIDEALTVATGAEA